MVSSPAGSGDKTESTLIHAGQPAFPDYPHAWLLLVFGLILTGIATLYIKSNIDRSAEQKFSSECVEIQKEITSRLFDHARILQSGAALFDASEQVTREKWHIFTRHQNFEKQLPGIQGIGFSLLIPRRDLARHIEETRSHGFPEYTVKPEGEREMYSSIVYLEPFSGRNLRAFGYDMFSEPIRRGAMERARDTNSVALSGKVVLVQETNTDVQAGTLMYMPVYRPGMPIDTLEQRRAAIYGWVYSPYRMNDLMRGIFGNHKLVSELHLHLEVFDGRGNARDKLLYDSCSYYDKPMPVEERFTKNIPVDFNGTEWTLRIVQARTGVLTAEYGSAWITLISGTVVTLLLFGLFRSLHQSRSAVQRTLADTSELLENEITNLNSRLRIATDSAQIGVWDWLIPENHLIWDKWMYFHYGIREEEFSGAYHAWQSGIHPEDRERGDHEIALALKGEKEFDTTFRVIRPSGEVRHIKANALVLRDTEGKPFRMIGVNYDITAQIRAEETLYEQADLLELEVAQRQKGEEDLAVKQTQLLALNNTLEVRVEEEVRKNREKDSLLMQQDKMSSIGQLAAGVAHEINNPMAFIASNLSTLKGYVETLIQFCNLIQERLTQSSCREEQHDIAKAAEKMDIMFILEDILPLISESSEGAERVKQIVNDLKEFARIEDGQTELLDLNNCVRNTLNIIRNEIKYVADLDLKLGEIPSILCSRHKISQVILNLLVNAAHAIDNHGTITVMTCSEGEYVTLSVSDTGHGMTEEVKKRIFDPFFTTKEVGKGTGLGLSISYGIIKEHGGEIVVESCEGFGSTFTVRLPVNRHRGAPE